MGLVMKCVTSILRGICRLRWLGCLTFFSDKMGLCSVGECAINDREGSQIMNLPPRQVPVSIR